MKLTSTASLTEILSFVPGQGMGRSFKRVSNSARSIPYRPFMSPARARSMPSPERGESGLSGSIP